ncbi:hypothetical protein L1987_19778 [Smallanthus sonchifolius]|uniref:Uncharacterized protein n=1 Tax=Smallanthus sonchifolius TaxID=185202 RepID=A0ACB9IRN4_9ASTR|nr:hypothetical protein L1987_19778 [Smallanthus sonchifolius]
MIVALGTSGGGISIRSPPPNSTRLTSKSASVKAAFRHVLDAKPVVERTAGSLYEVLRVERNATSTEIKTAYRRLAKRYHPDVSDLKQHGDRDFIEIHNAYATLSDPASRAIYDLKWSGGMRRKAGLYTAVGQNLGFYTCRRWETDQCW